MCTLLVSGLKQIQSYLPPKDLNNLDKIAREELQSRSITIKFLLKKAIHEYAQENNIKLN